jgi:deoxyribonuclease IV
VNVPPRQNGGVLIGAHVRDNEPIGAAIETGSSVIQIFVSDPQSWKVPATRPDAAEIKASGIPVYVHSPYIVNLASENNKIRLPSRKILQATCDSASLLGARGVVVHGGHVGAGGDVADGIDRWRKALAELQTDIPILVENTAGGDRAMARYWDDVARLWDVIGNDPRVQFCLDTCHTHASGEELVGCVERVRAITGRIDLLHCNGSRDSEGSGRDRHQNFSVMGTDNQVSPRLLAEIVAIAAAPVICETPEEGLASDIEFLRTYVPGADPLG